ncbi:hypothetical protein HK104_009763 [Borealophlyctis nickersoniae]|nr:hypothetical protein HK104_009763 [Borealophlyctis nickersoniae]
MVSFVCDYCQETLKKAKLDAHTYRCSNAQFSCIDCSVTFQGTEYRSHTSCVSEAEKYQKSLYKGPKKGQNNANGQKKGSDAATQPSQPPPNIAKAPEADSLIAQIKRAESQAEPKVAEGENGGEDKSSRTKKEKKSKKRAAEEEDDGERKAKKEKKKGEVTEDKPLPEKWDPVELDADFAKTMPLAVVAVLEKTNDLSLKTLRKKVLKKYSKHPKNVLNKEQLAEKFDEHLVLSLNNSIVSLKQ